VPPRGEFILFSNCLPILNFCFVFRAPDGRRVAYPVNSVVAMHDTRDGTQTHLFGHTERVHLLCFGRDGRVLVTGQRGRHPVIKVWDVQTGQCVATLYAHASGLKSLDVSPDGTAVVAAGTDTSGRQMIAVWDIGAVTYGGFAPMTLRHRTDYHVNCVRFSPFEEDHLVTCGKNSIRTYRLRKGQLRGCSVDLGDLRLSKLAPKTNQFQKKDEFELNDFTVVAFEIGYGLAVSLFLFPYGQLIDVVFLCTGFEPETAILRHRHRRGGSGQLRQTAARARVPAPRRQNQRPARSGRVRGDGVG
jgi:hypothetical protein